MDELCQTISTQVIERLEFGHILTITQSNNLSYPHTIYSDIHANPSTGGTIPLQSIEMASTSLSKFIDLEILKHVIESSTLLPLNHSDIPSLFNSPTCKVMCYPLKIYPMLHIINESGTITDLLRDSIIPIGMFILNEPNIISIIDSKAAFNITYNISCNRRGIIIFNYTIEPIPCHILNYKIID